MVHYNKTNVVEIDPAAPGQDNGKVSALVDRIQYKKGGKTFTGRALRRAAGLFPDDHEGRKQVMILLTGKFEFSATFLF